ncbi:MAG: penicillin-binding protein 2 [Hespellia sp.]|nr:penicillin-binding protein 2 [Hespellia sp.]
MARTKKRRFEFLRKKFPKRMQTKLVVLFAGIILVFVALIARITYINLSKGDEYTKTVLNQQEYTSTVIPFQRGNIIDRNGTTIATSERVYNVILDVAALLEDKKALDPTVKVLVDCFGLDETEVRQIIEDSPKSKYSILKKGIDYDTAKAFEKVDEDNDNYPNVTGIWLEQDYKRIYPYNSLASDLIGFSTTDNIGTIGIENSYNSVLNGTNGRSYGYQTEQSTSEYTIQNAVNGNNVVSTIDVTLQDIVEDAILEFNDEHKGEYRTGEPGSANTAVVIMDPNSGEILAESSYPNFDLNDPRDLTTVYDQSVIDAMSDDELAENYNSLWRNFAVSDAYEPGSTIKPFTVAAALETGVITGDETYYCGGFKHVGDYDIYCHNRSGDGTLTVEQAVAYSCNVGLMDIAEQIGVADFTRYQRIFGFGQYTGIDLPAEATTEALLYNEDNMGPTDLATNSFGQNFNVTMTQMVSAYASLVNGGNYYEPHVVKEVQDQNGRVLETKDPQIVRKTISEQTSEQIKSYLKAVVDYGTGVKAQVEGYSIGGKTGTAEKLPRNQGKYLLSFMGFAPVENPEVLIYCVIDEPNAGDQSNTAYVVELANKIMSQALPYLSVTKTADEQQSGTSDAPSDGTYTDFDAAYQDDYNNDSGDYSTDDYKPDYTDWVGDTVTE